MFRQARFALVSSLLMLGLTACGKKEEAKKEEAAPAETKPAFKAGEMVLIPAGEFIFGDSSDKESSAYPQQKINLPAYWIDKWEATNAEYLDFSIKTGYTSQGKDWRLFFTPDKANFPVVNITWDDAAEYCKSQGKRLPTEQEWEKAARGTDGRRYPWGEQWETGHSNTYETGLRAPVAVDQYDEASPYGVRDMLGNVQEWTSDWYKAYKGNNRKDPNFGERLRVVRGMSSAIYGQRSHLWDRSAYVPGGLYGFGCRCAKNATPEEAAKASPAK